MGSLDGAGWTDKDMLEELNDINNAYLIVDKKNFFSNFEKLDNAKGSAIQIYLNSKNDEVKLKAFKTIELLEFHSANGLESLKRNIKYAIIDNFDEGTITEDVIQYFNERIEKYQFRYIRPVATFRSKKGNMVYSNILNLQCFSSSSDKCESNSKEALMFFIFIHTFLSSPYDYLDCAEMVVNDGGNVNDYFNKLSSDHFQDSFQSLLKNDKIKLEFVNFNL